MDDRTQFKIAFMRRCIEDGITSAEGMSKCAQDALERVAFTKTALLGGLVDTGKEIIKTVGPLGLTAAVVAPPALGFAGGVLASRLSDVDAVDAREAAQQELLDEYKLQTERAKRQTALRHQLAALAAARPGYRR